MQPSCGCTGVTDAAGGPSLSVTPSSITFSVERGDETEKTVPLLLTNTGSGVLVVSSIAVVRVVDVCRAQWAASGPSADRGARMLV
jgi:hypothetical protein